MLLECFLHGHTFLNIFLHSVISFNELRQHGNDLVDLLLRDNSHAINGIQEDKITWFDDSSVNIQRYLNGVWFSFGSCSDN